MSNPRTFYLETFGCQMNVLDSQLVAGQLRRLGLQPVAVASDADVVLFNTCSVRQHAEDKVLSRLGRLKHLKRHKPHVVVGVLGCMAERQKEDLFVSNPHLDLLCGPNELNALPGLLQAVWQNHEQVAALAGTQSRRTEVLARAREYDTVEALDLSRTAGSDESVLQAYIRVQRGCDKFCTYCVVPFTRGAERSRPPAAILEEARRLADGGCREVTLLGQTVNSYVSQEDGGAVRFAALLERLHEVAALDRLRFVTSFPADWDDDIFRVMRDYPRVMPYLHIPAQSGSDRMLKAMRRGYTSAEYLTLMDRARQYVPDIALAGDFIVGFCGETDEDFQATVDLVRRVEYKNIFVFKYSPRPGTAADRLKADDVPIGVKQERNHQLLAVQAEISLRQKRNLLGQRVDVLVEGYSKLARRATLGRVGSDNDRAPGPAMVPESEHERGQEASLTERSNQLVGRTPQDMIVVFNGEPEHIGALVQVHVDAVSPLTLFGHIAGVLSQPRSAGRAAGNASLPVLHS